MLALASGIVIAAAWPLPPHESAPFGLDGLGLSLTLIAVYVLVHLSLVWRGSLADQVILPLILALTGVSLAMNLRLAPALATRQWLWVTAAGLLVGVVMHAPVDERRLLKRYRYSWAAAGIVTVAVTLLAGRSSEAGGPRLWLGVGPLAFQPSELLKLPLVVFLAGYLAERRELLADAATRLGPLRLLPLPYLAPLGVILGLSLLLLAAQGDLGAALLLFAIALGMLYLASSRLGYVAAGLVLFGMGAYIFKGFTAVAQTRVAIWLDPWSRASAEGFQVVQALMALAAGGVFGTGIGHGSPTDIPAVHTDFIYAALVEETGLAGSAAILALYALLVLRGFRIAIHAHDTFTRLLAAGLTFAIAIQTIIIVGGVVKLIPLTGITLPFMSYGGSSMVVSAVSAGLLLRASADPT